MKVQARKRYVTRDGRVTSPLRRFDNEIVYGNLIDSDGEPRKYFWWRDGRWGWLHQQTPEDLVREFNADPNKDN